MTYELRLEQLIASLRARWIRLLTSGELGIIAPLPLALMMFEMILKHYTADGRYYHNLFHLERMFAEFDRVRGLLRNPSLVEFAIFLHDLIYVIGKKTNEARSAKVSSHWLRLIGADALTIRRVRRLISVGTRHPKSSKARLTNDQKFISDFDLYGFSLSWDTVLRQSRDVRREFSKYSGEDFGKGNGDFILKLFARRIFHTKHYAQYELAAKANMRLILGNMDQIVTARPDDKRV